MVRHFIGSDPCAKPAPHDHHTYVAEAKTRAGVEGGRVYRHRVEDLAAEIRKHDKTCYILEITRGPHSHEERYVKADQAVDRWFELFRQAEVILTCDEQPDGSVILTCGD